MNKSFWTSTTLLALMAATAGADQGLLKNGSMESGPGPHGIDPRIPASWTTFGENVERSPTVNLTPPGLGYALKAFGDGTNTTAGALQVVNGVTPGQNVSCSVSLYSPDFDKLGGSATAGLTLEFLNSFGGLISGSTQTNMPFNSSSPADTWIPVSIGPIAAPASTAKVRVTCRLNFTVGDINGAVYWDGAVCTVNGGPNLLVNGDFETAGNSPGQSVAGIDNWSGFSDQEKSSLYAKNGTSSLQVGMHSQYSGLYQSIGPVSGGDHIYLLGYAYTPSSDQLNGSTRAGIKLEFQASSQVPPAVENRPITQASARDTWLPVSISTPVPAGITVARVTCIWTGDAATTGEIDFDSVYAERSSAVGVNQLQNPSFESGPGGPGGLTNWSDFYTTGVSSCSKSCFAAPALDGICTALATGGNYAGVYQQFTVAPGETLNATVYCYNPSYNPLAGGGTAGLKIEWQAGGIPTSVDIGVPCTATNTVGACMAPNAWVPLYIDYVVPAGDSANAQYTCIVEEGNATTGHVYFDSCEAVVINRLNFIDTNADGVEDMNDFAVLQRCYAGSGVVPTAWPWNVCDNDRDNDVDFTDATYFWSNMTGPN